MYRFVSPAGNLYMLQGNVVVMPTKDNVLINVPGTANLALFKEPLPGIEASKAVVRLMAEQEFDFSRSEVCFDFDSPKVYPGVKIVLTQLKEGEEVVVLAKAADAAVTEWIAQSLEEHAPSRFRIVAATQEGHCALIINSVISDSLDGATVIFERVYDKKTSDDLARVATTIAVAYGHEVEGCDLSLTDEVVRDVVRQNMPEIRLPDDDTAEGSAFYITAEDDSVSVVLERRPHDVWIGFALPPSFPNPTVEQAVRARVGALVAEETGMVYSQQAPA